MSLINKMLQDLDARGGGASQQLQQPELKAVPKMERDHRRLIVIGGGALAAVMLAAGGWFGWKLWQGRLHTAPLTAPALAVQPKPVMPQPQPVGQTPQPQQQPQPVSQAPQSQPQPADAPPALEAAAPPEQAAMASHHERSSAEAGGRHKDVRAVHEMREGRREARQAREHEARARTGEAVEQTAAAAAVQGEAGHDLSPAQLAENTYRRALVLLQEGHTTEALAGLERALEINPRNDAARQTYISLLLENKRPDDAIRQLRLALGLDPRQPGLAMLLARLELERNGPALETLQRTLPYADKNAEYHAFLAGVLQRQQRHAEAVEQYDQALKLSPQNGVWWMGLAISLQAEKHLPEAKEAFVRARSGGGMTPELQAFIDRRLEQLSR